MSNYTPETTAKLLAAYESNTNTAALASEFALSERSVIAKLVREGVYVAKAKPASARKTATKAEVVAETAGLLGLDATALDSLEKGSKEQLLALFAAVATLASRAADAGAQNDEEFAD